MRASRIAQETLLRALLWPEREGSPEERVYMYICG